MLLIGEQSTGKSTFMKILCFCCWLEKQVMIGVGGSFLSTRIIIAFGMN